MGRRSSALALALSILVAAVAAGGCSNSGATCGMCGRHECANMVFAVETEDGARHRTCCARCGARLIAAERLVVRSVSVHDFETAEVLDAVRAVYVEGSDVHPCRGIASDPPRDDRGCCLLPKYDRCEPSVLAFSSRDAAARFAAAHGGTLTTWDALAASSRGS